MLNRLQEEIKTALRNKDTERLSVLRMLLNDVKNEEYKEGKKRTADEVVMSYHKKLMKIKEEFANKEDFVANIQKELVIVSEFIPHMMSKEEVISFIKEANLQEVNMKTVMPLLKGKAESKVVQEVVTGWC
jgi:uncharacterized protein YqeY